MVKAFLVSLILMGIAYGQTQTPFWVQDSGNLSPTYADGFTNFATIDKNGHIYVTGTIACSNCSGGTQYADNAASGATPTGTLSMGWDSSNSKVRALKVDANQNLQITGGTNIFEVSPTTAANTVSNPFFNVLTDNAGHALTFNSTTYTGKYSADVNILGTLGTAFTTAGFVDIKGADGNVFVRCNAASTCPVNATLSAETTKIIGETIPVTTATTTDSALECNLVSAASTNPTNCKNASGNLYGLFFINTTGTIYYLRLYNLSSSPTCSSATGFIKSVPVPASTTGAGFVQIGPPVGYSTGISFCFTGGSSSTDNTNAAVGVFGTLFYK